MQRNQKNQSSSIQKMLQESSQESSDIKRAARFFTKQKFQEVINLLTPYYAEDPEGHSIAGMKLLAFALNHLDTEKKLAYKLWSIIYQDAKNKNLIERIQALCNMMQCSDNPGLNEQIALQVLKLAEVELVKNISRKEKQDIKDHCYSVCTNTGTTLHVEGKQITDINVRKQIFGKAKDFFEKALIYKPNNLICLLHIARLTCAEPNVQGAVKILEIHHKLYANDPLYHHALYQLYALIGGKQELVEKHFQKYKACTTTQLDKADQERLINLFADLSPSDMPSSGSHQFLAETRRAGILFRQAKFCEAKEILDRVLRSEPELYDALELYASIEACSDHQNEAVNLSEQVLKINPTSLVGIVIQTEYYWKKGPEYMGKAVELCERAFEAGHRVLKLMDMLIVYYVEMSNHRKVVLYAKARLDTQPVAIVYYELATAHFRLGEYHEAYNAFRETRRWNREFKEREVSLGIIYTLFMLSLQNEHYKKLCVKKLGNYLLHLESNPIDRTISHILRYFEIMGIPVPHAEVVKKQQDAGLRVHLPSTENAEPEVAEQKSDLGIPTYVKEHTLQAMKTSSFMKDRPCDMDVFVTCREEKEEPLFDIGGPDSHLKGYIPKDAEMDPALRLKFQRELEKGHLISASTRSKTGSNKTGVEKMHGKEKYAIKIAHSDFRLVSSAIFFKKCPGNSSEEKFVKVIKLSRVKTHSRLNS